MSVKIPPTFAWILAAGALGCWAAPAGTDSSGESTPPSGSTAISDTIARLRESVEIARLRDSLSSIKARRTGEGRGLPERPARNFLRSADSSLFASHSGAIGADYPLGPGDVLILSIWGQKQARYELEIDRDGQVSIPSIGTISLNGATFGDARSIIARRLGASYSGIHSGLTQIDLTLQKLKQIRVFVVGDALHPGGYMLSGNTSCLQAVALAGGPTDRGSDRIVRITRGDASFDVDLYRYFFLGRRPASDVLRDGDVVQVVPALGSARVEGAFARPGIYEILPGESVADLAALAGGAGPESALDQPVRLDRLQGGDLVSNLVGNGRDIAKSGTAFSVQPGDILRAPFRERARRASPVVTGAVRHPGAFPYDPGLTLRKLVSLAGGTARGESVRTLVFRTDSVGTVSMLPGDLDAVPELRILPSDSVHVVGIESSDSTARIQVEGAVRSPGTFRWYRGMRLKDVLSLAGGTEDRADRTAIQILEKSANGNGTRTRSASIDTTAREAADPTLAPYSLVIVPFRGQPDLPGRAILTGHVLRPGPIPLRSGRERISSLVQLAGGPDSAAYPEGAFVWRRGEGRIPLNLARALARPGSADDIVVQPGDSIDVPSRPATVQVSGMVNRPTSVLWRKGKGWKWYVRSAGDFADSANREAVYVRYADGSIQSLSQGPDDPDPGATVVVPRRDPPRAATSVEKISAFGTVITAISAILTVYVLYLTAQK